MRNIFIQGIEGLLGCYFAARCLQWSDDRVFYFSDPATGIADEPVTDLVARAARQIVEGDSIAGGKARISGRVQLADVNTAVDNVEVWYFEDVESGQTGMLDRLLSVCVSLGAKEFNYVGVADAGAEPAATTLHQQISQRCEACNISYRIFHTSLIVGNGSLAVRQNGACSAFFSALHSIKAEIEERSSQYFDFKALRCLAPGDASVNLVPADIASDLLLRIARRQDTANYVFHIVSPKNIPFSSFCERISIAYNLSLIPVTDLRALNAIDREFQERVGGLESFLMSGNLHPPSTEAYRAADLTPGSTLVDEEAQITLFKSLRQSQDEALAARRSHAAELPDRLAPRTINRGGSELTYYVAGTTGIPVVVLNALGQGLEYWYRLLDDLRECHRVIIWEPRGAVAPPPPFSLTDQVDDLDAVLHSEGIDSCHLIGWCTGPKVAIDFYLRHPSLVRSMAFLNTTFKCDGSPEELDSPYEQNMESLCRMMVRKRTMAASVMSTLKSRIQESETEILEDTDGGQVSVNVLSLMNKDLQSHVLSPFRTEDTTVNYAHQLVDFWKFDVRARAHEVRIPVLLMSAEYDQVATPATSFQAVELFPNARHVHVNGATHYCLYDRPEFVAGLLKTFFANPVGLQVSPSVPGAASDRIQAESVGAGASS